MNELSSHEDINNLIIEAKQLKKSSKDAIDQFQQFERDHPQATENDISQLKKFFDSEQRKKLWVRVITG